MGFWYLWSYSPGVCCGHQGPNPDNQHGLPAVSVWNLTAHCLGSGVAFLSPALLPNYSTSPQLSCDPVDCSSPHSSVYGILQARILQWIVISFSRGSSQPRDGNQVSCIGRQVLYRRAIWGAQQICGAPHIGPRDSCHLGDPENPLGTQL